MTPPQQLVVDALAAYRLTRLVSADTITAPIREAIIRRAYMEQAIANDDDPLGDALGVLAPGMPSWQEYVDTDADPPKLATLVTCRWCTGVWVALGVVVARRVAPRWWGPVADGLAVAAAAALVAGLEDDR